MRRSRGSLWMWLAIALAIASLAGTYVSWRRCDGKLVRGLFWWECVR